MTDIKNTVSDAEWLEEAARYFENRDTGGEDMAFWANVSNAERCRSIAQSLRASIPGGVGVKGLEWEDCTDGDMGHLADTVIGRYAIEQDRLASKSFQLRLETVHFGSGEILTLREGLTSIEAAKSAAQADYERRILSALDLSPADTQCCMCGKTGLSTIEGDGGTECQLEDGRWTCSEPCWEKAGGYGPDLSPAEGETSDGSEQAAIEIADAVIAWMVRYDLLDADQEYRDDDIIAILDELSPGLETTNDEAFASPLAAPSNPVISDEMVEQVFQAVAPHIAGTDWREVRAAIVAALSVKPQSDNE